MLKTCCEAAALPRHLTNASDRSFTCPSCVTCTVHAQGSVRVSVHTHECQSLCRIGAETHRAPLPHPLNRQKSGKGVAKRGKGEEQVWQKE